MKGYLQLGMCGLFIATAGANLPAEVRFNKTVIDENHRAESSAAVDMNNDGRLDIVAGNYWYEAPTWERHKWRELSMQGGYADVRCDYGVDYNGDGWTDIATVHRAPVIEWLENPGEQGGKWKAHKIGESTRTKGVVFEDVDGDGRRDFVGAVGQDGKTVAWWKAPTKGGKGWKKIIIGPKGGDLHGLGVGDLNRDGNNDIITRFGWYASPSDPVSGQWKWHQLERGQTHRMEVYDFDGDGDNDIAAGAPHDYGLYWWSQKSGDDGPRQWQRKVIDDSISQMNTVNGADIDGDGDMDLVSGKRWKAHHGKDPGTDEPAVLVWYELQRNGEKATFTRHVIDDDSGIGYIVTVADIDGDGDEDVITSNQKGVFLFEQQGEPEFYPLVETFDRGGWLNARNKKHWSREGNTLIGKATEQIDYNDYLMTHGTFGDFVLTCDVKLVPNTGNSGIQFRSVPLPNAEIKGYQADIGKGWWGSIYEEHGRGLLHNGYKGRGEKAVQPGQWNHYVLYAVGDKMRVEINGTVCTHLHDDKRSNGMIALQIHSGPPMKVRFRDLQLRLIKGQKKAGK
jgi:hypothetical protein